jgi:hypothetical protein
MPSYARKEIVADGEVGIFHCVNRCVRRAWLCGQDPLSGKSYDHRKDWIRERLEELAGIYGVDILGFAVMANHVHVVLRTRPDVVETWSDDEVARRWWRLFPKRRDAEGRPADPEPHELGMLTCDRDALAERRRRLGNLSWFMRCLCEPIARRANKEDRCTGRFWEGRFKSQKLLDEAAVLACSVYVDLNPIRAGIATTPEASEYTSAQERIETHRGAKRGGRGRRAGARRSARGRRQRVVPPAERDGWLCPIDVEGDEAGKARRNRQRRASDKGFLSMRLEDYLEILDWTGRQVRGDKRGAIPADISPILQRLGLSDEYWIDCVKNFGRWFHRAAGRVSLLAEEASRAGKRWLQGVAHCQHAFT